MSAILSDNTKFAKFCPRSNAKKDPFVIAEDQLNRHLLRLHKQGAIPLDLYSAMRSTGSQPAGL